MIRESLKRLTRESLIYGLGQTIGRGLQMILVPVFTRVFTPAEYGVVDLMTLVSSIAAFLIVMGTDGALARFFYEAEDGEARRTMVTTSAAWRAGLALAVAAALWASAPLFSQVVLASPDYAKYVRLTALSLPFTVFVFFQNDVLRVTFQPVKYIVLNVVNTLLVGGLSILFVVGWQREVSGVLYARILGDALTALLGFILIRRSLVRRTDSGVLRRMLAYGLPTIPAGIAFWAISYGDRWVLVRFADLASVGVYAVAAKIGTVMTLAVSAFHLAWGPFAYAQAREAEAGRLFARVLTLYTAVASTLALAVGLVAPEVLAVLVPAEYRPAAFPGGLLAFASVAYGGYMVTGLGAALALRTDLMAWTSIAAGVVTISLAIALVGPWGLVGVAAATLAGFTVSAVALYAASQRVYPIPFRGVRAFVLFGGAVLAYVLAGAAVPAVSAGPATGFGVGVRALVFLAYAALAFALARRIPEPAPAAARSVV
ncbi:MAG: oligosaccharide flippase family protein [Candidatus Eiseniibacteriota bacterium]